MLALRQPIDLLKSKRTVTERHFFTLYGSFEGRDLDDQVSQQHSDPANLFAESHYIISDSIILAHELWCCV